MRRPLLVLAIVTVGCILLPIGAVAAMYGKQWLDDRPIAFVRETWMTSQRGATTDRMRNKIAYMLVESKMLIGKSKTEIVALLGEPDRPTYRPNQADLSYVLGPCGHLAGIDTEFLVMKFDGADRVSVAGVVED